MTEHGVPRERARSHGKIGPKVEAAGTLFGIIDSEWKRLVGLGTLEHRPASSPVPSVAGRKILNHDIKTIGDFWRGSSPFNLGISCM